MTKRATTKCTAPLSLRAAYSKRTEARAQSVEAEDSFSALLQDEAEQLVERYGNDVAVELAQRVLEEAHRRIKDEEVPF